MKRWLALLFALAMLFTLPGCSMIERELGNLTKKGRPLSQKSSPEQLYASRIDAYKKFADVIIYSNEIIEDTANKIISEFEAFIGRKL